jgi:hypothetical protein
MQSPRSRQIAIAISTTFLLAFHFSANGEGKPLPTCLAGVCVGKQAPTESALKTRFGGQAFDLGYRTRGYCYELKSQGQLAHLLFALKNFGDGWRVVSVRAASRPICAKSTPLMQPLMLKTGEGVALGGTVESVRGTYGAAAYTLDPRSRVVAEVMASQAQGVDSAMQYVPADPSLALSAVFVFAGDRVVAIEVSSDI